MNTDTPPTPAPTPQRATATVDVFHCGPGSVELADGDTGGVIYLGGYKVRLHFAGDDRADRLANAAAFGHEITRQAFAAIARGGKS
jgi:hypothetical protein